MQEWSHNTGAIVAYLRKSSAPCVSGYAGAHTRIIIRIMLVFLFCYKKNDRIQHYYAIDRA